MTRHDDVATGARQLSGWVVASAVAGTLLIALGAFWLSFTALTDLAARAGIAEAQAWVWPLIVDGIIVVATISAVALAPFGRRATWYPWLLLVCGATVSVAANAAHAVVAAAATLPAVAAAAISAVPPLVLLAITHLTVVLAGRTRPRTVPADVADMAPVGVAEPGPAAWAGPADGSDAGEGGGRREAAWARRRAGWSNRRIAHYLGVHPSTVGRWFADPAPGHAPVSRPDLDAGDVQPTTDDQLPGSR